MKKSGKFSRFGQIGQLGKKKNQIGQVVSLAKPPCLVKPANSEKLVLSVKPINRFFFFFYCGRKQFNKIIKYFTLKNMGRAEENSRGEF